MRQFSLVRLTRAWELMKLTMISPFPLKIWNILDIKRASALLFLLFNIVWAASRVFVFVDVAQFWLANFVQIAIL